MIYKTVSPAELRNGDLVRRFGRFLTVTNVVPASVHGAYDVTFEGGETVRFAGAVSVVSGGFTDAPLAR
jgi:hypothetical protein